jgi:hypothetical protein
MNLSTFDSIANTGLWRPHEAMLTVATNEWRQNTSALLMPNSPFHVLIYRESILTTSQSDIVNSK